MIIIGLLAVGALVGGILTGHTVFWTAVAVLAYMEVRLALGRRRLRRLRESRSLNERPGGWSPRPQ